MGYQKMKSGIILLPIGLSVNTLKDIIFKLILATAAAERCWCGNHSAFLEHEDSSSILSGRPLQKKFHRGIFKTVLWSWIYSLLELALGFGFSAGMSEQGRLKEEGWNLKLETNDFLVSHLTLTTNIAISSLTLIFRGMHLDAWRMASAENGMCFGQATRGVAWNKPELQFLVAKASRAMAWTFPLCSKFKQFCKNPL